MVYINMRILLVHRTHRYQMGSSFLSPTVLPIIPHRTVRGEWNCAIQIKTSRWFEALKLFAKSQKCDSQLSKVTVFRKFTSCAIHYVFKTCSLFADGDSNTQEPTKGDSKSLLSLAQYKTEGKLAVNIVLTSQCIEVNEPGNILC